MRKAVGQFGEDFATRYLKKKGYRVLARNWKAMGVELDIVCKYEGELVFVEVKTRRSRVAGDPEDSVTVLKRSHLERAAHAYLDTLSDHDVPWRVDVVAINLVEGNDPEVVHFEGI
ncbi:YraN family protein [Candidatus Uhrbacteria bacterium]|jgi:putative endonuclease|nr:YraN family protein [Candidatus Uhrbacteria bacterium]